MDFQVDPHLPIPIHTQIVEEITHRIASGELRGGEQLPSIRKFCVELRINPNTVLKAYRELEELGFVRSHHGLGFFIVEKGVAPAKKQWHGKAREEVERIVGQALAVGIDLDEIIALARAVAERRKAR